jgi:hypothetical protein
MRVLDAWLDSDIWWAYYLEKSNQEVTMQEMSSIGFSSLAVVIPILLLLVGALVLYLVLMIRAIIEMLRYDVNSVLLTFAFLGLIPFPLVLIMGVMILIIWYYHKRDILAGERQSPSQ